MWTKTGLSRFAREKLSGYLVVVVSNREPYIHTVSGGELIWKPTVGGLAEALDPVLRAARGIWIAHGAGDADRRVVDARDHVAVPPDRPEYTLRRIWLTDAQVNGFYLGFANRGLWPLCHNTPVHPEFKEADWLTYKQVNRIFADAVLQEIGEHRALVLVQDYHLALVPRFLKEKSPRLPVGQFWHIPWPPFTTLQECPWHQEILAGLLGNDSLGFHIKSHCLNFMESAEKGLKAVVDPVRGTVGYQSHRTLVEPFPISVDFAAIARIARSAAVTREMEKLRREFSLEGKYVGVGMDRVDYTKGIPERLKALDKFFADNTRYHGKVVFIVAGMPSRQQIAAYAALGHQIETMTAAINEKYGTSAWQPVVPLIRQLDAVQLNALRRLANFCVVSSLHDGMNLVAKEFVAARTDGDGVLVLSRFAGAAEELTDALLITPRDIDAFATTIKQAIEMPELERRRRMANMRKIVVANNIYRWGGSILTRLLKIAEG
jgi:trehalose-6-phosphate synthase